MLFHSHILAWHGRAYCLRSLRELAFGVQDGLGHRLAGDHFRGTGSARPANSAGVLNGYTGSSKHFKAEWARFTLVYLVFS